MTEQLPVYRIILEELREKIIAGTIPEGAMIPKVNELCEQHQVSHITIGHVLRELAGAGAIERRSRGYRVPLRTIPENAESYMSLRNHNIGLLLRPFRPPGTDNFFNDINLALESEIAQGGLNFIRSGGSMVFNHRAMFEVSDHEPILRQLHELARQCCALIVDERVPERVLGTFLPHWRLPLAVVNRRSSLPVISIAPDYREILTMILDHARRSGCGKVIFCNSDGIPIQNISDCRQELKNLEIRFPELKFIYPEGDEHNFTQFLKKTITEIKKADGYALLLCSSSGRCQMLANSLADAGLKAPRDFGFISMNFISMNMESDPNPLSYFCSVRYQLSAAGKLVFSSLLSMLRYPWSIGKKTLNMPFEILHGEYPNQQLKPKGR